ncbi:MAG: family 78 glycoside hydrolase catalytic domain, partial [Bacteroidetes bacterium]|nr:family 78 glycoside hydrolase catalytic domain [Bacteroidota bacterium]
MKNKNLFFLALAIVLSSCSQSEDTIQNLEVDFISNLGQDPVFSWKTDSGGTACSQSAWQIIVSDNASAISKNLGNIWDSDKQDGKHVPGVQYAGEKLESGKQYFAKLRTWDKSGIPSAWSETERFVVPLEYPGDWNAEWVTYDYADDAPLPVFRKSFGISDPGEIEYARLYIAAPGFYEAYLNGVRIGENVLDPGQTNYEDYTYYVAYDIDAGSLDEENFIGIMLGNGWYNQNEVWNETMIYGQPVFISQLVIQYKNGNTDIIASDDSWQWAQGPILRSNIYGGESYDARLEKPDWPEASDAGSGWNAAIPADHHPTMLYEQFQEPIRVMEELEVKEIIARGGGTYILDLGRNIAGWTRLKIQGTEGQEIIQRFVEELDAEGNIDPASTGVYATELVQTSRYICKGDGVEVWEPRFVYYGFRYVEVEGLTAPPEKDMITGLVVRSALPSAGSFSCSENNINKLHQLSRWTMEGNIHSIPTDCPHREKCGWTGDAHALVQSMIFNYDSHKFFLKYMLDMRSSGREEKRETYFGKHFMERSLVMKPAGIPTMIVPGRRTSGIATADWGTALVQIPWYLYLYYGDRMILEEFYGDMQTWVSYIHAIKEDGIIQNGLGDWCPPGGNVNKDCPVPLSSTAFHILDVSIMEKVSALLGKKEQQKEYAEMQEQLTRDFNRHFLDTENATYGTHTGNVLALDIGMVPEDLRDEVAASLVRSIHNDFQGFINTGIFGIA